MNDETMTRNESIAPGEGERRAQRGYVPQYDLAARVVYEALAAGRLRWIGVADRGVGAFDDIVLGLHGRIVAHQVKTSRDPEPFTIRTLLVGAEGLWRLMLETRRKLRAEHPDTPIEVVYACDDYPRINDGSGEGGRSASSAAFVRTHAEQRLVWTLADWRASPFAGLLGELQAASGLGDEAFAEAWRDMRFLPGGQGRHLGFGGSGPLDERRVRDVAALLPRLAADPSNRDRWLVADLLARLGWRDPFSLRHGHAFPVDALHQANAPTQERLHQVLLGVTAGYVGLIGPPGCGKSTLLATGLLPTPRAAVVRYLAFVPDEGHGLGRAEAEDFLQDVIAQLKGQGLGGSVVTGSQLAELRTQFEVLLREAGERFRSAGVRTLIVVDGLDHVPREERPGHSFLRVLPQPHAVPEGVVFVLGTQRLELELDGLPPEVSRQAAGNDRCVTVAPLSREAVGKLADAAGIPADVDRIELYDRTAGHPLSTRYVIEGLRHAETPACRKDWLRNGPAFGGDVDTFYQRAWHDLERAACARRALAYVALAEGPLHPSDLDRLVGSEEATDVAWRTAKHLLIRDHRGAWSIFHNSFRLFLRRQAGLRHGVADEGRVRRFYTELADMSRGASPSDPQRWMELRYRARAGDHPGVAALAAPARFRAQFAEGRDPGDIQDDVGFAFRAAGALRLPDLLFELVLMRHELSMRCDALGDEVFDALIHLGDRRAALGLLNATGVALSVGKGYDLVGAFLAAGEAEEARRLFEGIEPTGKLLGAEPVEVGSGDDLVAWAKRALVFREPAHFLASIDRLQAPDERLGRRFDMDEYRAGLRLHAVRGQLERDPSLDPRSLVEALSVRPEHLGLALYFAAREAFAADDDPLVVRRLEEALRLSTGLETWLKHRLAILAARIARLDLAAAFFDGLPPPTLPSIDLDYEGEEFRSVCRAIVEHAALNAQLGRARVAGAPPQSRLLAAYQVRLEMMGTLLGEGRVGRRPSVEPLREFLATLNLLQHDTGDKPHDAERRRLDHVLDDAVATMVNVAAALGPEVLRRLVGALDDRFANGAGRLGTPGVRRAYAMAVFRHDFDAGQAALRLPCDATIETTPAEQLAEAARTASDLAALGFEERARAMLADLRAGCVGYARPAKKDAQYAAWRALLVRACDEDPAGRAERLRFLGRVLTGMAETEGYDAGRRLVPTFLEQAAKASASWAKSAADRAEEIGSVTWTDLAGRLLTGVAKGRPDLAAAAGVIFGRVALPFGDAHDSSIYVDVIRAATREHLEDVVRHAVACIETDGHPDRRILSIEEVVEAASDRGFMHGADALNRWRDELPPPQSGNSPEDPFFLIRTVEDIAKVLQAAGNGMSTWGAAAAFERIAPRSAYAAAAAVFAGAEVLQKDGRAVEAMARVALAGGRRAEAISLLDSLKRFAEDRGTWGYIGDRAKHRYHRLNVLLNGEDARRAAFDNIIDDLANRRESLDSLFPEIDEVLTLLSPQPSWSRAWVLLQDHLAQFREHRIGRDLDAAMGVPDGAEHTLADVLFRAFDTTAIGLGRMARTAAIELAKVPAGGQVLAILLPRLWRAGGQHALEATQVAWECRDLLAVRDAVVPILSEMCEADDLAVRRIAMSLGRGWGQWPRPKRADLPVVYKLELPPNPQAQRFEPPSGTSPTSPGLYTEDPYTWTWPLRFPLRLAAKATGLPLPSLRARAAQLMSRAGGTAAFGPDAVERQQTRLHRLRLHLTFRKLLVGAAFQAMREVAGELAAADAIDQRAVPLLLHRAGSFPSIVSTEPPAPRPAGVLRAHVAEGYITEQHAEWQANVAQYAVAPTLDGHLVLAATAVHARRRFRDERIIEQYFGPDTGRVGEDLSDQLSDLPQVLVTGEVEPLYEGFAPGGVARPKPTISNMIDDQTIMLCPHVAAALGWRPDPKHALTYLDSSGTVVARTLYWRDGGELSREADAAPVGYGYILIVREDCAREIEAFLVATHLMASWRITQENGRNNRLVTVASRTVGAPS
jgi:hypothetical protein